MFELAVSFVSEPSHAAAPVSLVDYKTDEVRSATDEQSDELTITSSVRQSLYSLKHRDGLGCSLV